MTDLIMSDLRELQDKLAIGTSPARVMAKLLHVVVSQQKEIQKLQDDLKTVKNEMNYLKARPF